MSAATAATKTPERIGKPLPSHLEQEVQRISEISSLPEVTTKIVQVVEDPKATAHDMHEIVRTDPALATKILKVVNSAFYGLPSQIASLDRAIVLLGLSAVKNIALAASLSRLFKADAISEQFAARDLWRHCIAVGVCARMLARAANCSESDEAFVAGLVHDLGLITVQQLAAEKIQDVANRCLDKPQNFCSVEEAIVGADHQAIGGALGARWKFPPGLRYVIAYHHEDPAELPPEFQKVNALTYIADVICCQQQFGFWLTAQMQEITDSVRQITGVTDTHIEQVSEALEEQVEEAEQIFGD